MFDRLQGRKKLAVIAPAGIAAIALFIALGGTVVEHLWNWLAPELFGWPEITFWQALGMLVLCRILFGGFGGGHGGRSRRGWEKMSPEERERFRQGVRERCGLGGSPAEPQGQ